MFVTTAIIGCRCRNDASLSSASATRYWPSPSFALAFALASRPPITNVGSTPRLGEHAGDQARRRRLAVRAGDRDAVAEAHELGQHLGAAHDGNAARVRGHDLGIVGRDGARDDDDVGVAQVLGGVTLGDAGAERAQPLRDARQLEVRAADRSSRDSAAPRRCRPCRRRRCRRSGCCGCGPCASSSAHLRRSDAGVGDPLGHGVLARARARPRPSRRGASRSARQLASERARAPLLVSSRSAITSPAPPRAKWRAFIV